MLFDTVPHTAFAWLKVYPKYSFWLVNTKYPLNATPRDDNSARLLYNAHSTHPDEWNVEDVDKGKDCNGKLSFACIKDSSWLYTTRS
jgi:hypothetical protein